VKPGGTVVLTTPNGAYFRNPLPCFSDCADPSVFESEQFKPDADGHIFLLRPEETARLACAVGLDVIETRLFCNPLTHGHLKLAALVSRLPERLVKRLEQVSRRIPVRVQRRIMTSMAMRLRRARSA
jgi:2-polyprenyl-6-hydroxyphenyl methylase/3-demethylubiquinone-9 3-methyltransferase